MNLRDFSLRKGLTLIELLIFAAIFSGAAIIFVAILVSVTRVELRQTGAAEVQQQSQFVLQTVQNAISGASYITTELPLVENQPGVFTAQASSGIRLRMADKTKDPTRIYWDDGKIILGEKTNPTSSLTSPAVRVTDAEFTQFPNPPGHDSVNFTFTIELVSSNPQRQFSQTLATGIARVGAATFDDNLNPMTTGYALGNSGVPWASINNIIYFGSGGNVGIGAGAVNPTQKLEVNGGVRLNGDLSSAMCGSSGRGTLRFNQNGSNASDTLDVCLKKRDGTYEWQTISR